MVIKIQVGQHVKFFDEDRVEHDALVTTVWGKEEFDTDKPYVYPENWPTMVNLVYVLKDPKMKDQYGNQTRHATSISHRCNNPAGGYMWEQA